MKNVSYYFSKLLLGFYRSWSFRGLKNKDFSIISNNCTGGFIYQDAKLEYRTPTIGLFIHAPCYLTLLTNFELINEPLQFIKISKYPSANVWRTENENFYPIAILNGRVEIHFLHYNSVHEADSKWKRRLLKLDRNNLLFIFSDRDHSSDLLVDQFLNLPFANKLCFSARAKRSDREFVSFRKYRCTGEFPPADEARIDVLRRIRFAPLLNSLKHSLYGT